MRARIPAGIVSACLFYIFVPCLCLAATVPAGFPAQPLWLSEDNVTAGDSVGIFTVLYNESAASIQGSVAFSVDSAQIATVNFALDPGKNEVLSTAWTATAGTHRISAAIAQASGANAENVSLAGENSAALSVDVASPPPPSQAEQNATAVSNVVNVFVASSSPAISNAAQNTFAFTEAVRQGAVNYLENQLGTPAGTSSTGAEGQVLGVSTFRATEDSSPATSWWSTFVHDTEEIALAVARSVALFYPVVAVIILGGLYLLMRTVRRPYSRY